MLFTKSIGSKCNTIGAEYRYVLGDYCENATEVCMAMAAAEGCFYSLVVHEIGKLFGSGPIFNKMHGTRGDNHAAQPSAGIAFRF